jgi:large subunit ribosomal protein L31e
MSNEKSEVEVPEESREEETEEIRDVEGEEAVIEKEREAEEDIVEERIYTVPLRMAWIAPRKKRSPRAIRILRSFIRRHMKIDDDSIIIANEVNEKIWDRGIEKPPRKIRIRAVKDTEGMVTIRLAEGD